METITIQEMLESMGIKNERAQETAVKHLVKEKLISGCRKRTNNIACTKLRPVQKSLRNSFAWHCQRGDCKEVAKSDKQPPLLVDQQVCSQCDGSSNRRELREMSKAMTQAGLSRILVIGCTEKKAQEIQEKSRDLPIEWRFVDGTKDKDDRYCRPHCDWADIIVIRSSTPLRHAVADQFTKHWDGKFIRVPGQGIKALARSVTSHLNE